MPGKGDKKSTGSPWGILLILIFTLVCTQAYFYFKKSGVATETKPPAAKPAVKQPVKPSKTGSVKPASKQPSSGRVGPVVGRIAVVIDDWGYNNTHCKYLAEMPYPAGIAILPGLPYSKDVIQCSRANGKQPMLHIPLEPFNHRDIYKAGYVLTTDMDVAELRKTQTFLLDEMTGVIGVNNHTGSKGSESELLMTALLTELKRRKLFFVDSVTSEKTVAGQVAAKLKMRIAKRNVFLDNRNERAYILRQFEIAANIARKNGYALVIGHDRVLTLQIIIEQMQKLSAEGFEFISVPEYIKSNEYPRY